MAQDVIVKKDSTRIAALIEEISDTEIRYQEPNDTSGILLNIALSEVAFISLANGDIYSFSSEDFSEKTSTESENPDEVMFLQEEKVITLSSGREVVFRPGVQLESVNGHDFYGDFQFKDEREYKSFLKQICIEVYRIHEWGKILVYSGGFWAVAGYGGGISTLFFLLGGGALGTINLENYPWLLEVGAISVGIGLIGTIVNRYGKKMEKRYISVFNQTCALSSKKQNNLTLSLNLSCSSIGLTLSF